MLEKEINGKANLLRALEAYELLCYEKYAPFDGEITYSEEHIKRMARIIRRGRAAGINPRGAVKYAAIAAAAAFAVSHGE